MSYKLIGTIQGTTNSGNQSGMSVCLTSDGKTVAVGEPYTSTGRVRTFNYNGGTNWNSMATVTSSGDRPGTGLSLNSDGTIVAVGEPFNDASGSDAGRVRIFKNISGTTWKEIGSINGLSSDLTGYSASLNSDGTIVAVGDIYNDASGSNSGRVRIFKYSSTTSVWTRIGTIIGTSQGDETGWSVSLSSDGTIVAVGDVVNDVGGLNAGRVRIFQYTSGTTWNLIGTITGTTGIINGITTGDKTGYSVSLSSDGRIVAVGEPYNKSRVRIFKYNSGTVWDLIGTINRKTAGDETGYSVSLNSAGTIIAIGEPSYIENGVNLGRVRIFKYSSGTTWNEIIAINGTTGGDLTGYSVSLNSDGSIVAFGEPYNNEGGLRAGRVRIYQLKPKSKTKMSGSLGRM